MAVAINSAVLCTLRLSCVLALKMVIRIDHHPLLQEASGSFVHGGYLG